MNFSDNIGFYSNEALPLLTSGQKFCLLSQETSFVTYTCDFAAVCPRLFATTPTCPLLTTHRARKLGRLRFTQSPRSRLLVSRLTWIQTTAESYSIGSRLTWRCYYEGKYDSKPRPISHAYALCSLIGECGRIQTFS